MGSKRILPVNLLALVLLGLLLAACSSSPTATSLPTARLTNTVVAATPTRAVATVPPTLTVAPTTVAATATTAPLPTPISRTLTRDYDGVGGMTFAFSPDGKNYANGGGLSVRLFDFATKKVISEIKADSNFAVAFSSDGKMLTSGGVAGTVNLIDIASQQVKVTLERVGIPSSLAFSPDGKLLAVAGYQTALVKIWEVDTQKEVTDITMGGRYITFSPDGELLVSGGAFGGNIPLQVWNVKTKQKLFSLGTEESYPTFSPDGQLLVSSSKGNLNFWDVKKGTLITTVKESTFSKLAFSPDGQLLAFLNAKELSLMDVKSRQVVAKTAITTTDFEGAIAFHPSGKFVVAAGTLWEVGN